MKLRQDASARDFSIALTPTVFHEDWWLQAASRGTIREAVVSSGGRVIGRLPYMLSRRETGHHAVTAPELTPELGPALLADRDGDADKHSLKRFNLTTELIAQLPRASHTFFEFHRRVPDTMAFEAAHFRTRVRFAFEVAPHPADTLWLQMRDKTRNVIRRAQEKLTIFELKDPEQFLAFYEANIRDRHRVNYFKRDICIALLTQSLRRDAGRILIAVDANHKPAAGIFTVWDRDAEYYMLSTRTLESPNGAVSLLLWEAMQNASRGGRSFDMMGIRDPAMLNFYSGFGGRLKPRFVVSRSTFHYDLARSLKSNVKHSAISATLRRLVHPRD